MKSYHLLLCWAAVPLAASMAYPSFAQQNITLSPIVVTATRTAVPLTDVLADVSYVDREQIERSGATSVSDVLARLPGITISQNGGPTTTTSVFIRGAESRFTAVFIDGVRVDSQSTGGATWESIPLAQIEHIEVLRGPAAAVYGSDAIAGVVQIFTRKGEAGFFPSIRLGAGTFNTRELSASLRGGAGDIDYAIGLASESSDGFNANPAGTNPDLDGYRNHSFSGRLGYQFRPGQKIDLTVLNNKQKTGFDAFNSIPPTDDLTQQNLQTIGINWSATWNEIWKSKVGLSQGTDRYETTPPFPYLTETTVKSYLLHNEILIGPGQLTAALERKEDQLLNSETSSPDTKRSQNAIALGYGLQRGAHAIQVNARHDQDSEFGSTSTSALTYGYTITPSLRATVASGTAFRAPTLYHRFSPYGNPNLKPETSDNNEIGLRWMSGSKHASVVAYQNKVANLIDFSDPGVCASSFGCYRNIASARMTGVTITGGTQISQLNLGAALDFIDPKNLVTDKTLARRAKIQATLTADATIADWRIGGELQHFGERFDYATKTTRLAPYGLVNVTASKHFNRDYRLLVRLNNLTNTDYELASGYATAGRTVFASLTWAPQ